MPDLFVPFDTSYYTTYYRDILRKGILNKFTLEYVDKNRARLLKSYKEFAEYENSFSIDQTLFDQFTSFASTEGVKINEENLKISGDQIKVMLKALIAKDLYGGDEFFQIFNTSNNTYNKAIEVLKSWNKFSSELLQ
jgi:carboxyl-terminal processing protease